MKVVLFAGGRGLRMREYSDTLPKPLVPVGGKPILRHLMEYYAGFGHRDFILCLGHRAEVIRGWIQNAGDIPSSWRVTTVDTGVDSTIGERLRRVESHLDGERWFLANYSDGLSDLDLEAQIEDVRSSGKVAGFACVKPPLSFHLVDMGSGDQVRSIEEISQSSLWINGGFFVFRRDIFDWIRPGEELVHEPFQRLIEAGELHGYRFRGFWRCMDTPKDRDALEAMVASGQVPWIDAADPARDPLDAQAAFRAAA